jgi:hypothetical protein
MTNGDPDEDPVIKKKHEAEKGQTQGRQEQKAAQEKETSKPKHAFGETGKKSGRQ